MRREQLEHIIRAAADVTDEPAFVVIGSQSILGALPDPPAALLVSIEADIYPRDRPDLADLIEGSLGELSSFHEQFGYYAQGVGPETAVLPEGWQERLVELKGPQTGKGIGFCLDPHDLAVSKLVAMREKDAHFVRVLLEHRLVDVELLIVRIGALQNPGEQDQARAFLQALLTTDTTPGPSF